MKHDKIDSTQMHGNEDMRAQEPSGIRDTEDGTQIMKTQNMQLGAQGV